MRRHHSPSAVGRRVVRSHGLRNRSGRARQGDGCRAGGSTLVGASATMKKTLLALLVFLAPLPSARARREAAGAFYRGKASGLIVATGRGSGYKKKAGGGAPHL